MRSLIPSIAKTYSSPLGDLALAADTKGLLGAWFDGQRHYGMAGSAGIVLDEGTDGKRAPHPVCPLRAEDTDAALSIIGEARAWLDAYFSGREPEAQPSLHLIGSAFQHEVWAQLVAIPYGKTVTYGDIAVALTEQRRERAKARGKDPSDIHVSARAVGGAGRDPTPFRSSSRATA